MSKGKGKRTGTILDEFLQERGGKWSRRCNCARADQVDGTYPGARPMNANNIKLTNSRSDSVTLFLEPWAEELVLTASDSITIIQDPVEDGRLELELVDEGYVFYGNMFVKLRIYRNGELIWESYAAPGSPKSQA
jgi:hypothetical protein